MAIMARIWRERARSDRSTADQAEPQESGELPQPKGSPEPLAPAQPPELPDVSEWLRAHGVTVAAVTFIAIQLCLKGALLADSYFRQDDYLFIDRALASGFGWTYLMWVEAGHLLPLGTAIIWVQVRLSLYNWPLACAEILLLLAAACFAMLRVLRTLFGNRSAILIPLGIFLFSPLSLAGVDWWVVSLEVLPLEIAMLMAIDAHVRYLRGGRLRNAVAAAIWLAVGMAAMDKGAVVPLLLFALTAAFFAAGPWSLLRYGKAWALYGVVLAGYCAVFFTELLGSSTQLGDPGSVTQVLDLTGTMLGSTLFPGALGGPWQWLPGLGYADGNPPAVLQHLSWVVALIVVVISCAWRVRAWRAWAILAGWIVAADIVPVTLGRLGFYPVSLLGVQVGYLTDATGVLALCVALAFFPLAGEERAYRFRISTLRVPTRAVIATVACAFLAGSLWSLQSLKSVTSASVPAARSYIATAQAAVVLAPRGTVIVDSSAPAFILDPGLFGSQGDTSRVIGAIAREDPAKHLTWVSLPRGVLVNPMIFNGQGQLRQAAVNGVSAKSTRRCWPVTASGTSIPLSGSLFNWTWIVQVSYSGPAEALSVRFGGNWSKVALSAGTHVAYVPVVGNGNVVSLQLGDPVTAQLSGAASGQVGGAGQPGLCVTGVTVGTVQPVGQAIPAAPVRG